jgi:hypothetical protein
MGLLKKMGPSGPFLPKFFEDLLGPIIPKHCEQREVILWLAHVEKPLLLGLPLPPQTESEKERLTENFATW